MSSTCCWTDQMEAIDWCSFLRTYLKMMEVIINTVVMRSLRLEFKIFAKIYLAFSQILAIRCMI